MKEAVLMVIGLPVMLVVFGYGMWWVNSIFHLFGV
jgi:hypothetical protein